MKIPVFLSCPIVISGEQNKLLRLITGHIHHLGLEPRTLRDPSKYPVDVPMNEVYAIAKDCHGGVIVGFEQFRTKRGTFKPGSRGERSVQNEVVAFSSPWNQIEAGMLVALQLPLLILRSPKVKGGVFEQSSVDSFVHELPRVPLTARDRRQLAEVFLKWNAGVRAHYFDRLDHLAHTSSVFSRRAHHNSVRMRSNRRLHPTAAARKTR